MTGKSESTVWRIVNEGFENDGKFETPGKQRQGRPKKEMDDLFSHQVTENHGQMLLVKIPITNFTYCTFTNCFSK
ncbi:hypothetical protein evm_013476 [Chilo suppressalis]|nr:hypothetical protein evm_013476 [Chilo suppressalis]